MCGFREGFAFGLLDLLGDDLCNVPSPEAQFSVPGVGLEELHLGQFPLQIALLSGQFLPLVLQLLVLVLQLFTLLLLLLQQNQAPIVAE